MTRVEFETFADPVYPLDRLKQSEPSSFNGIVRVLKWRIVAEVVYEPEAVIKERLVKLWHDCDNHHEWTPIQKAAAMFGLKLDVKDVGKNADNKRK